MADIAQVKQVLIAIKLALTCCDLRSKFDRKARKDGGLLQGCKTDKLKWYMKFAFGDCVNLCK